MGEARAPSLKPPLPQERQQQDDRDRHADKPEQNSASHFTLPHYQTKLYDPTRPCGSGSRRNAWNFITQLRFFRRAECGQAQRENDMSNITEFETGSLDVVGVSGGGNASAVSWGAIIAGAVAAAA